VFDFWKLRAQLNKTFEPGNASLEYDGIRCHQVFSLNYGVVEYVVWDQHRANAEHLPNPISYTYLKDMEFSGEKELRISLSAVGLGKFALADGSMMEFPPSLQAPLDFKEAIAIGSIRQILCAPDSDAGFLKDELQKLRIVAK
jgi:hypothetical protein